MALLCQLRCWALQNSLSNRGWQYERSLDEWYVSLPSSEYVNYMRYLKI